MTSTLTGPGEPGRTPEAGTGAAPSSTAANEAIRRFVAGRTVWSKEALAELDRLRGQWQRAVRAEMVKAA
ncbi:MULTISPECIES: hypothetical protein [Streptomyces]|uniref:Uncharacterized protein n=1 Tax=Streptomyces cacaoi TaxID=1898 RepID=A0A4Y3R8G5_STRCI|nr:MULTISPECIES: hypothetical protein [Streptomyces]NNG85631.1 hypothetical protein [Streptomyces cacaoi]QHF97175.1 hypothetical protein DEH18_28765 [Streptomyces sp. NHF165]GEB52130.1 hypothetical protein SCA03_46810 [Streptomyces cacaoi]